MILSIGDYKGQLLKLIVSRDCGNIIHALNFKRGYNIVYYNKKNKLKHLNYRIKRRNQIKEKFKKTWTVGEIIKFNANIKELLLKKQEKYKFDGLIYFISATAVQMTLSMIVIVKKFQCQQLLTHLVINCVLV